MSRPIYLDDEWRALRQRVLERDHHTCTVCGYQELVHPIGKRSRLQVHHKTARAIGGDDSESNLVTLCDSCHSSQPKQSREGVSIQTWRFFNREVQP